MTISQRELAVGECFDRGEAGNVILRSCADPHELEVFGVVRFSAAAGAPLPDADAFDQYVKPRCETAFVEYVGRPEAESAYSYVYATFDRLEWSAGERRVPCAAMSPSDQGIAAITGSLRGANR